MFRVLSLPVAFILFTVAVPLEAQEAGSACRPNSSVARMPALPEASGLALSHRSAAHLWTHNDSGEPIVFALDQKGAVTGTVRISGAKVEDWEALAVGPCSGGSCLYVADIGDNDATRKRVTIYRIPEPEPTARTAAVDAVFHLTYPDGPHDAEALLMTSSGEMFIVTKGDTGPVALYRAPRDLRAGSTTKLERVGQARAVERNAETGRITDGDVSPDGQWVVLRSRAQLVFYRADDFFKGTWREARRVDLASFGELQGEGIALGAKQTVYLAGEGGGKKQPGTFLQFSCAPGQ